MPTTFNPFTGKLQKIALTSSEQTEIREWLDDVTLGSNGVTTLPSLTLASGALTIYDSAGSDYATIQRNEANNELVIKNRVVTVTGYSSEYPPAQNATYVKATSSDAGSGDPFDATDPAKSLTGTRVNNSWRGAAATDTNQRFHIDLGSAKTIKKIYYENFHHSGTFTDIGVQNFTFWGSNTAADFADLVYGNDGTWVSLTISQSTLDEHTAVDVADPKYIDVTNTTAYRYYALKCADNWGYVGLIGIRRIELQTATGSSTVEVDLMSVVDSLVANEKGITTIGGSDGQTILDGNTVDIKIGGSKLIDISDVGDITLTSLTDSTTALSIKNQSLDSVLIIDTVNDRVGIMKTPTVALDVYGKALFQSATNAVDAFKIVNSAGSALLIANTSGYSLGIGTSTPTFRPLHIVDSLNGTIGISLKNTTAGNAAQARMEFESESAKAWMSIYSASHATAEYADRFTFFADSTCSGMNFAVQSASASMRFQTGGFTSTYDRIYLDGVGNIGFFGANTFGITAVKTIAIKLGTAPTTNITDQFAFYGADIVAGNTAPHFRTESGQIIKLYQQAHIIDADGTLADITTKFNTLLSYFENTGFLATA